MALDALLYPELTGEMIDGFVQQYRDGGWIGQWTAPGYLGFSGTNSDAAIADAHLRGVTEDYVADYGISQMSLKLYRSAEAGDPHKREYLGN